MLKPILQSGYSKRGGSAGSARGGGGSSRTGRGGGSKSNRPVSGGPSLPKKVMIDVIDPLADVDLIINYSRLLRRTFWTSRNTWTREYV
jgi:hypothetical protein